MAYCTVAEVREVGSQITATAAPVAWTNDVLEKVIARASRIFDQECNVEPGYFEVAGVSPTNKTVYGDGGNFLRLLPYVAGSLNATLTYPDGYTALEFIEQGEEGRQFLRRADANGLLIESGWRWYSGWYANTPIIVSARWGFTATPDDVKHAVIELVINLVKEIDPASVKMMNLDGLVLRESMPPRVARIAKKYKYRETVLP
jgi:hypothetical protein